MWRHFLAAALVLFTPLMWLGNSEHHLDFPGTMTASPRVYLDLLRDMVENFIFHGFRRIVLVNGHGGNIVPAQQALFELRQKHRDRGELLLLSTTYWTLGGKPNAADKSFVQNRMGHACEWETSMMLRIAPHLVGDLKAVEPLERFGAVEHAIQDPGLRMIVHAALAIGGAHHRIHDKAVIRIGVEQQILMAFRGRPIARIGAQLRVRHQPLQDRTGLFHAPPRVGFGRPCLADIRNEALENRKLLCRHRQLLLKAISPCGQIP